MPLVEDACLLRARLWRDFQSIRFSVLQDQPRELPPGDSAGEPAHLATSVLREVELFTGNNGLQTARFSEVGVAAGITSCVGPGHSMRLEDPLAVF